MTVPYREAQDLWAKRKVMEYRKQSHEFGLPENVQYVGRFQKSIPMLVPESLNDITILDVDIEDGGDVQIGDMTWDHDDASIEITYSIDGIGGQWGDGRLKCNVPLEFGVLVQEIVGVAEEILKE